MPDAIYEAGYVRGLFDEMAQTYGIVNLITSFGFAARWRSQCLRQVPIQPGMAVFDLMTGMGELCPSLARRLGTNGSIRALDLSPEMCKRARRHAERFAVPMEVIEANVLESDFNETADVVVSSFGLKTFSPEQQAALAKLLARMLKPGGRFSFLEISVPANRVLRGFYSLYIGRIIPLLGWLLLGNPANYRMLGVYTSAFGNCDHFRLECAKAGLHVDSVSYCTSSAVRRAWWEGSINADCESSWKRHDATMARCNAESGTFVPGGDVAISRGS